MRFQSLISAMIVGIGLLVSVVEPAMAATPVPFTQAAFEASQQAGKPILVHVEASWCTTCAQQRPLLAKLEAEPQYDGLVVYNVDFDHQKDVVRAFKVQMQSTLIAFHGKIEEGRSTGDTDPASIRALVQKSLG
jgi:thioredoxin 1